MTESMTDTLGPNPVLRDINFVPITIYGELLVDGYGKRQEKLANYRKLSNKIENVLDDYSIAQSYTVEISKPIKYTLAFGNLYPRVTINGNVQRTSIPQPKEENLVIQSNEFKRGFAAYNNGNSVPVDKFDQYAKEIFDAITAITSPYMTIKKMLIGNIIYGEGGRSIQ